MICAGCFFAIFREFAFCVGAILLVRCRCSELVLLFLIVDPFTYRQKQRIFAFFASWKSNRSDCSLHDSRRLFFRCRCSKFVNMLLSAPKGAAPSLIDRLDKILDNSLDNALDNGGLKTTCFRCFQSLKVKGLTTKGERLNYER